MALLTSLVSLTLDLPPSCIAFCQSQPELFVVGTYFLHPPGAGAAEASEQKRTGSLILYQLQGTVITHLQTVPLNSAVLDVEWATHDQAWGAVIAVATSTGSLEFFELDDGRKQLRFTGTKQVADAAVLVLDLAWHPLRTDTVGVTLSDGRVCLCVSSGANPWDQDSGLTILEIQRHTLEPWTLAFTPSTKRLLSGGDDMVLQLATTEEQSNISTIWQDRNIHQAGVTAILPLSDDFILTGSYDDHIRLLSAPTTGLRQTLAKQNVGGGVWRLKLLNWETAHGIQPGAEESIMQMLRPITPEPHHDSYEILASCMHAGSHILRLQRDDENGSWGFHVLARFAEHRSMNYGSDVQPGNESLKTIVSTSFYDKLLCLWQHDIVAIHALS